MGIGDALHPPFKGRLLRHREGKKGLFLIDWTATFHDQKAIHSSCIFCWLYPKINTTGHQKRNFIKIRSQKTRLKLRCVLDLNPLSTPKKKHHQNVILKGVCKMEGWAVSSTTQELMRN